MASVSSAPPINRRSHVELWSWQCETSKGSATGPASDPRTLYTAHWRGSEWLILPITTTDHNYNDGSIYLEAAGGWRFIAATAPGPLPYGTGQSRPRGRRGVPSR